MPERECDNQGCLAEIQELRARLDEAEETLRAIRSGEVDALVVSGPQGNQIYTLKGAESTYRVLVEAMNEGALVLTPDGTVMYSNHAFADMVETPLERVIGARLHEFVADPDQPAVDELLEEGQKTNTRRELELKNEPEDRTVPALVSVANLPDHEAEGLSAVVTDLTVQKMTEAELRQYREHLEDLVKQRTEELREAMEELEATNEELRASTDELETSNAELKREIEERERAEQALKISEERFRALIENTQDAIIVTDPSDEGRIISVNPAASRMFLRPAQEMVGLTRKDILDVCDPHVQSMLRQRDWRGAARAELAYKRSDGTTFSGEMVSGYFTEASGKTYAVSVIRDTTERKQAEEALAEAKDLLQHQVQLLQKALIPTSPPAVEGYSVASEYIAAVKGTQIGGDFLDVFRTENGKVGVLIGDVSGKGIESAALAATTRSTIRAFAYDLSDAGSALTHANSLLCAQQLGAMQFVTSFLAVLDPVTGEMNYASAGHPPAMIIRADGSREFLETHNTPLGVVATMEYDESEATLQPGDKLMLYTDGITEARKGARPAEGAAEMHRGSQFFGMDGVECILDKYGKEGPKGLVDAILSAVKDWSKDDLRDDTAVLIIGRRLTAQQQLPV